MIDPVRLAQALIRRPSITPEDAGALSILEESLKPMGFSCHRLRFEQDGIPPVDNLYARIGSGAPHFCFAGHTDVVPPGDIAKWSHDPFAAEIADGVLYGRGVADMKGEIAAFVAAAERHLAKGALNGSISFMITGDEEGNAINGTPKILTWLAERGETIDHCLLGEPSSVDAVGDTLKIGRRGSLNVFLTAHGTQGHAAYADKLKNPVHALAALVTALTAAPLDGGSDLFDASTLTFSTFDVGNPTVNVVPAQARAHFNIRFNDLHTPDSLKADIDARAAEISARSACPIEIDYDLSGISSVVEPGDFTALLQTAVASVTGKIPALSTGGGTSDARFILDHCPAVELGLFIQTIHQIDERAKIADIEKLADIYEAILSAYFAES